MEIIPGFKILQERGNVMKLYNMHIDEVDIFCGNKTIIAFGAGNTLKNFICQYGKFHFEDRIQYVADNNERLSGTQFEVKEKMIPIISFQKLLGMEDYLLMIACQDYVNVYRQLDEAVELNDIPCFITTFIDIETKWKRDSDLFSIESMRITKEPMIPKKIHYCWFGKGEIPPQCQLWMSSWQKYCPDYEIIRWDETNYDVSKNRYMAEAYRSKVWGYVPDYARLDILYREGGIYLDTDVELVKNIDELLYQPAFAGIESTGKVNPGLGFGSVCGHPMIRKLRDAYDSLEFVNDGGGYGMVASPTVLKPIFEESGYVDNGEYQIVDDMTIYPEIVLSGMNNVTGAIHITDSTYAIHHYAGTWISEQRRKDQDAIKKIYENVFNDIKKI